MTQILQEAGDYTILTPVEHLRHQLQIIERAGRTAYQSFECPTCKGKGTLTEAEAIRKNARRRDGLCGHCSGTGKRPITEESATRFIEMLISRGHESVLEHSNLTVRFELHCRGFTHEQVRHRLTAITQESTRYVDERERAMVLPPGRDPDGRYSVSDHHGTIVDASPRQMAEQAFAHYRSLREANWPPEDARQFLPIGTTSEIVISANFREWRHIFHMRCDKFAHWEIRRTMCMLLVEMQQLLPGIFDDFVFMGQHSGVDYFRRRMPISKLLDQVGILEAQFDEGRGAPLAMAGVNELFDFVQAVRDRMVEDGGDPNDPPPTW